MPNMNFLHCISYRSKVMAKFKVLNIYDQRVSGSYLQGQCYNVHMVKIVVLVITFY